MVDESPAGESTNGEITFTSLTDDQLRGIVDFNSAQELFGSAGTHVAEVLGNGFSVIDDKRYLLDTEIMIVNHQLHESGITGTNFSTLHAITRDGEKLIVNDGSTGIHLQCMDLDVKFGKNAWLPLYVPRGLRLSEYEIQNDKGDMQRAQTFYLNTSN